MKKNNKKIRKNKKTLSRKEFTTEYQCLAKPIAATKKAIKSAKKSIIPLARMADRLHDSGDALYVEEPNKPIAPSFKTLPKMMENLERWICIDDDIQDVIDIF